jgi:hypothetical protein
MGRANPRKEKAHEAKQHVHVHIQIAAKCEAAATADERCRNKGPEQGRAAGSAGCGGNCGFSGCVHGFVLRH